VQRNILERHPSVRLRVYAIWTDKRFFDSRAQWDAASLVDKRVTHLWDGDDLSGRWLVEHGARLPGRGLGRLRPLRARCDLVSDAAPAGELGIHGDRQQ
jgi:hypothetical protein